VVGGEIVASGAVNRLIFFTVFAHNSLQPAPGPTNPLPQLPFTGAATARMPEPAF